MDTPDSACDVGLPKLDAALLALAGTAHNATQVNVVHRTILRDQIADRTATYPRRVTAPHQLRERPCATGGHGGSGHPNVFAAHGRPRRAAQQPWPWRRRHCSARHVSRSGHCSHAPGGAEARCCGCALGGGHPCQGREAKHHPQQLRERHLLRAAHLQRVAAIALFVPVGDVWSGMSLKGRRQVLAEVVEVGVAWHGAGAGPVAGRAGGCGAGARCGAGGATRPATRHASVPTAVGG